MTEGKTIYRAAHDDAHPYRELSRATLQDKRLSYDALGLLVYLLSQSDTWDVVIPDLMRKGCKRDKVYKLLNELRDAGYIVHERLEAGQQKPPLWAERRIYERPFTENPETVTPYTEIPETAISVNGEPFTENPETVNVVRQGTHAGAITSSTESFEHLTAKDKSLKDKNMTTSPPARVAQIKNHPIWQAFTDGYPKTKPRVEANSAVATWNAIEILQQGIDNSDFTLQDITETVKWQLGKARQAKYFITYVDADLPDYLAYKLALKENGKPRASTLPFPSPPIQSTNKGAPNLAKLRGQ